MCTGLLQSRWETPNFPPDLQSQLLLLHIDLEARRQGSQLGHEVYRHLCRSASWVQKRDSRCKYDREESLRADAKQADPSNTSDGSLGTPVSGITGPPNLIAASEWVESRSLN